MDDAAKRARLEQIAASGDPENQARAKALLAKMGGGEKQAAPEQEPGIVSRVVNGVLDLPGKVAGAAKDFATAPGESMNAAYTGLERSLGNTHEKERSASIRQMEGAIESGQPAELQTAGARARSLPQNERDYAAHRDFGDLVGPMMLPMEGVFGAGLGALLPEATGVAGRAARTVAIGAGSGAGGAATRSAVSGNSPGQIASDTGVGGILGGVFAAPFAATEATGVAASNALTNPRTKLGRNNRALEATADYRSTPEYKQLPKGEPGIDQAAYQEGQAISDKVTQDTAVGKALHKGAVDEVISSNGTVDQDAIKKSLYELRAKNVNKQGVVADETLEGRLAKMDELLTPKTMGEQLPVEDALFARDYAEKKANFGGANRTDENKLWGEIYHSIKDALETSDERIGPINKMAREQITKNERTGDLITKNGDVTGSDRSRLQSGMKKLGTPDAMQGIGAAGADALELGGIDAAYAEAMKRIAGKTADVNTSFGWAPTARGLIEKNLVGPGGRAALPVARGLSKAGGAPWIPGYLGNTFEDDVAAARERIKQRQAMEQGRQP